MIDKMSLKSIPKRTKILILHESYAYLLPCLQLRNFISNFTITFPNKSTIDDDYTIMPHGSVTLVLLMYKNEFHSFLFGSTTKPVKVGDIANKCDLIFIIEFQPAGICPFTNYNQKELVDKIVPFSLIENSLDKELKYILNSSTSVDELLIRIEEKLIHSIRYQYPKEIERAIKTIIKRKGNMTSLEISDNVFYSSRQLNRLFNTSLGMSMKSFSRLVRINNSLKLLNDNKITLMSICNKLGYYDASHFIKDFKIVCGITPLEYKKRMSSFYNEIAKY